MSNEARDYECVICPNCKHQFRGLSDSDETDIADLRKDLALSNKYAGAVHKENKSLESDLEEANALIGAYRLMEKEWRRIDGERRLLDAHVSTRCQ